MAKARSGEQLPRLPPMVTIFDYLTLLLSRRAFLLLEPLAVESAEQPTAMGLCSVSPVPKGRSPSSHHARKAERTKSGRTGDLSWEIRSYISSSCRGHSTSSSPATMIDK